MDRLAGNLAIGGQRLYLDTGILDVTPWRELQLPDMGNCSHELRNSKYRLPCLPMCLDLTLLFEPYLHSLFKVYCNNWQIIKGCGKIFDEIQFCQKLHLLSSIYFKTVILTYVNTKLSYQSLCDFFYAYLPPHSLISHLFFCCSIYGTHTWSEPLCSHWVHWGYCCHDYHVYCCQCGFPGYRCWSDYRCWERSCGSVHSEMPSDSEFSAVVYIVINWRIILE